MAADTAVVQRAAPGPWPAPTVRLAALPSQTATGLYVLHVILWDLHAARFLGARLIAAGVARDMISLRGRRVSDGLNEAQVRDPRTFHRRWRTNLVVVVMAAFIVGIPLGAAVAMVLFGEVAAVAALGAFIGVIGLGAAGWYAVMGDHFQWVKASQHESRVEGHLVVRGDRELVRAEMLVATTADVMTIERLPVGANPLDW